MTRILLLSVALLAAPMAALALPAVGDIVGTNPDDATAALKAAGCDVTAFEAEGGKIDSRCTDAATCDVLEVSIDPKTGAVLDLKKGD